MRRTVFVDNERSITVNAAALAQTLPVQLRLALAPQPCQLLVSCSWCCCQRCSVTVLAHQAAQLRRLGEGGHSAVPGSAAGPAGPSSSMGSNKAGNSTGQAAGVPGGGGMAAAVSAGLVAAAAAVGGGSDARRRPSGGAGTERQPLLSSLERSTRAP